MMRSVLCGYGIVVVSLYCEILCLYVLIMIVRVGFFLICGLWINFLVQGEIIYYVVVKFNEMC